MKLQDKIIKLRKSNGLSQEELAEKLNVSRQSISRWEGGLAQPDATNILQLSKLFNVTADYLLNDDYESDNDLPKSKEIKQDNLNLIMIAMVTLEIMIFIIQFITFIILQDILLGILSFIPFVAIIGIFEYEYQKKANKENKTSKIFQKRFYKISTWLGTYFPIRFIVTSLTFIYPRPFSSIVLDCVVLVIYLINAILISLLIEKNSLKDKKL